MPHKPSPRGDQSVQFVSVSLTVALKPQLKKWAEEAEPNLMEHLGAVVTLGYRVTVKELDEGFVASMAPVRLQSPNKGLVLMEHGSTPDRALLKLLWAHEAHFQHVWPRDKATPEDDW